MLLVGGRRLNNGRGGKATMLVRLLGRELGIFFNRNSDAVDVYETQWSMAESSDATATPDSGPPSCTKIS